MSKHRIRHLIKGKGNLCPKCQEPMERRIHKEQPTKTWFYKEWDWCPQCKHLQHYDEFKSPVWQETELQENHLKEIWK